MVFIIFINIRVNFQASQHQLLTVFLNEVNETRVPSMSNILFPFFFKCIHILDASPAGVFRGIFLSSETSTQTRFM